MTAWARRGSLLAAMLVLLTGCPERPDEDEAARPETPPAPTVPFTLTTSSFSALAGWEQDAVADALPAFRLSCAAKMPRTAPLRVRAGSRLRRSR